LEAADALEAIYIRMADYGQLVLLLQRKMEMVEALADRRSWARARPRSGRKCSTTPTRPSRCNRQVLALDDSNEAALENLVRLFLRLSRWNDLKDVYSRQAELATDPAKKKERLFVLGQVYDRELQDAARAIETYTSILDMDPDDLDALQALDRLYLQTRALVRSAQRARAAD